MYFNVIKLLLTKYDRPNIILIINNINLITIINGLFSISW